MTSPTVSSADALGPATERLLATVHGLSVDDWSAPSLCTGWTRAHVLAHLALNAEGLSGVLRGIRGGSPVTMYASAEARDSDIDDLAAAPPSVILERLVAGCAALGEVLDVAAGLPEGSTFERTPDGPLMPAPGVPHLRLREVEIHHADLDAGYSWVDWPAASARAFLDDDLARFDGSGIKVAASDVAASWDVTAAGATPDEQEVVVTGPIGALAWWATGREVGSVVSSSTGHLPTPKGR